MACTHMCTHTSNKTKLHEKLGIHLLGISLGHILGLHGVSLSAFLPSSSALLALPSSLSLSLWFAHSNLLYTLQPRQFYKATNPLLLLPAQNHQDEAKPLSVFRRLPQMDPDLLSILHDDPVLSVLLFPARRCLFSVESVKLHPSLSCPVSCF